MKESLTGRWTQQKAISIEDNLMEDNLNGGGPFWKTTSMKYDLHYTLNFEGLIKKSSQQLSTMNKWMFAMMEDTICGRQSYWKMTSMEIAINQVNLLLCHSQLRLIFFIYANIFVVVVLVRLPVLCWWSKLHFFGCLPS